MKPRKVTGAKVGWLPVAQLASRWQDSCAAKAVAAPPAKIAAERQVNHGGVGSGGGAAAFRPGLVGAGCRSKAGATAASAPSGCREVS
jgi:hypothetical protein